MPSRGFCAEGPVTQSVSGFRCAPGRCQHMCMMTAYHWHWQEVASARQELLLSPANPRVARVVDGGHRGLGAGMSVAAGRAGSLLQMRLPELQSRNRWARRAC